MHRPRIERIHHLAIAVPSLEGALDLWRDVLGVSPDIREFPEQQLREAAFPIGDVEIRLWQWTGGGGAPGLQQIGLQITGFDDVVAACRTVGLQPAELGPAVRPQGRRKKLVDATGEGPAFELVEARAMVCGPPPVRLTRASDRPARRQPPGPRTRPAKSLPGPKALKTAKAPRPSVRPRGKVHKRSKKPS